MKIGYLRSENPGFPLVTSHLEKLCIIGRPDPTFLAFCECTIVHIAGDIVVGVVSMGALVVSHTNKMSSIAGS